MEQKDFTDKPESYRQIHWKANMGGFLHRLKKAVEAKQAAVDKGEEPGRIIDDRVIDQEIGEIQMSMFDFGPDANVPNPFGFDLGGDGDELPPFCPFKTKKEAAAVFVLVK